jgi:outer membrane protein OmpA-like peptidoglycan-associated protein
LGGIAGLEAGIRRRFHQGNCMLSSYRGWGGLLAVALVVSGCTLDQRRESPGAAHPPREPATVPKTEPPRLPPPVPREPARPVTPALPTTVPSAPTSGGVGYYQDRQQAILEERLAGTGLRVVRNGESIKLIVPGRLIFSLSSDQIQPAFASTLDSIALVLKEYSRTTLDVRGYTDSTGSFEHNQALSERRARNVGAYLVTRQIAATRIRTAGFGPRNPLVGNDTESGRAQNRRIEIELVPTP